MNIAIKWDIDRLTVYQFMMAQKCTYGLLRTDEIMAHSVDLVASMAWDKMHNEYFNKNLVVNYVINMSKIKADKLIAELIKQINENHYNMFLSQMFGKNVVLQKQ